MDTRFVTRENKDKDMEVHQYLPTGVDYYQMMRRAKFCLCPSWYEVASPRVGEALHTGCVPVLLSSAYTAPFSDVLNWNAFSVTVPIEDILNLKNILTSISTKRYLTLQRRGVQIRRHFVVNFPPKRYDMYHMILHSIWLRRLNVGSSYAYKLIPFGTGRRSCPGASICRINQD
uniref:Exostosin GT47 domain-containing protein n=1 Tax=Kalanchoe fedtschenkoi TaxID=63787 RepID=A0A7N0TVJ3_KALFE